MSSHENGGRLHGSKPSPSVTGKNWFLALSLVPAAIAGVATPEMASAREPIRPATAPRDDRHEGASLGTLTIPATRHTSEAVPHATIPCRSVGGPLHSLMASRDQVHTLRFSHHREFQADFLNTTTFLTFLCLGEEKHNKAMLNFARSALNDATTRVVEVIPPNRSERGYKVLSRTHDTITLERREGTVVVDKTIHLPMRTIVRRMRLEQTALIEVSPYLQIRSITLRSVMPQRVNVNGLLDLGPFTTDLRVTPCAKKPGTVDLAVRGGMQVTTHRHILRNIVLDQATTLHNEQCAGVLRRAASAVEREVKKGECTLSFFELAAQAAELARAVRK